LTHDIFPLQKEKIAVVIVVVVVSVFQENENCSQISLDNQPRVQIDLHCDVESEFLILFSLKRAYLLT
jgi:hypothetical protein